MPTLISLFPSQQKAKQCAEQIKQQGLSQEITLLDPKQWSHKVSNKDCNGNIYNNQDRSIVMMNVFDAEPGDMSVMLMNEGVPQPKVSTYHQAIQQGNALCMIKNITNQNQDQILNIVNQTGALTAEVFPYHYSSNL